MKVYIVEKGDCEDHYIEGVYTTLEQAMSDNGTDWQEVADRYYLRYWNGPESRTITEYEMNRRDG